MPKWGFFVLLTFVSIFDIILLDFNGVKIMSPKNRFYCVILFLLPSVILITLSKMIGNESMSWPASFIFSFFFTAFLWDWGRSEQVTDSSTHAQSRWTAVFFGFCLAVVISFGMTLSKKLSS